MDVKTFDRLARTFALVGTRRAALAALLAGAGSALGLSRGQGVSAQTSCTLANGDRCLQSDECCSGLCKRKRHSHKKFCKAAPGQGICTIDSDYCANTSPSCGTQGGAPDCVCARRPNGASVCAYVDPALSCAFEGDCTDKKCRTLLNNKQAFCGKSIAGSGCCDGTGVCLLPCESPDALP